MIYVRIIIIMYNKQSSRIVGENDNVSPESFTIALINYEGQGKDEASFSGQDVEQRTLEWLGLA